MVVAPGARPTRNSRLPSPPATGDGIRPRIAKPEAGEQASRISAQTASWIAGSRTMPPRPTRSRPASNCGLISAASAAPGASSGRSAGRTSRREMKLTSMAHEVRGRGIAARSRLRASVPSRLVTRGSAAQGGVELVAPDVDGVDVRGAPRQQRVGEAAGRGPDIEADAAPPDRSRRRRGRPSSFSPPRETKGWGAAASMRASAVEEVGGPRHRLVVGPHEARRDGGLRPGPALEMAALHQQAVGPQPVLPIITRPSWSGSAVPGSVLPLHHSARGRRNQAGLSRRPTHAWSPGRPCAHLTTTAGCRIRHEIDARRSRAYNARRWPAHRCEPAVAASVGSPRRGSGAVEVSGRPKLWDDDSWSRRARSS